MVTGSAWGQWFRCTGLLMTALSVGVGRGGLWSMKGLGSRGAGGTEDCVWSEVERFEVQESASDERVSR